MADVAVVIPCRNANAWIAEAVESVLSQGVDVEIVVVDDGSDVSPRATLAPYLDRLQLLEQPRRGAPAARNAGLAATSAPLVQFLDADDVLPPGKLQTQSAHLAPRQEVDVVYGDWCFQRDHDGVSRRDPVTIAGAHDDHLAALLGGWWAPLHAYLYRRSVIEQVGGWREGVAAGQDRDFNISIAEATDRVRYVPGLSAIYRRHGTTTITTSDPRAFYESHTALLRHHESRLQAAGQLNGVRADALGRCYYRLARNLHAHNRPLSHQLLRDSRTLSADPVADQTRHYRRLVRILGFRPTEELLRLSRYVRRRRAPV